MNLVKQIFLSFLKLQAFIAIVVFLFFSTKLYSQNKYLNFFKSDYFYAVNTLKDQEKTIDDIAQIYDIPPKTIRSIVFPELLRYNNIKDFIETSSLETFYIAGDMVDFSIGYFQMKPSFMEEIEQITKESSYLKEKYKAIITYSSKANHKAQRLNRLKQTEWQVVYICCFIDYLNATYQLEKETITDRLSFLSAAYNYGFKKPPEEIKTCETTKAFPYGKSYKGTKFSYSEIALHYYNTNK